MSNRLVALAESFLVNSDNEELNRVLKDYLVEKRFIQQIPFLSENGRLKEICQDRDKWEQKYWAPFYKSNNPKILLASFDQVIISNIPEDISEPICLNLIGKDYSYGNYNHSQRRIYVLKEWFFCNNDQKPWIDFWNLELIKETRTNFIQVSSNAFPQMNESWFYGLIGASNKFFESSQENIMKKINRFQNFNCCVGQMVHYNIPDIQSVLLNYRISIDIEDTEDGNISLINYLISLDKFEPDIINDLLNKIKKEIV